MQMLSSLFRVSTLVFCLAVCLFGGCGRDAGTSANALTLTVITPHGSDIRREFAEAFSAWHEQRYGSPVQVVWPDVGGGGTGNIVRQLDASYANGDTSGYDVAFGGGSATFRTYLNKGYLAPLPPMGGEGADPLSRVPADIFKGPLHGRDAAGRDLWVAATMSAFGMAVNKQRIEELGLPMPRAWGDIAKPEWFGHLSLADPSKSGSVKTSYEMILQQYGWERGWAVITQLFANAAVIRDSGGAPADDVSNADAVAGIVIDFYGRLAGVRAGEKIVGFVIPDGGTILDADPIAMLKGAPHPELAARFIRFVVSPEGQRIWILRSGSPGGPRKSALGRLSVLPDLYRTEAAHLFDARNPFDAGSGGALTFNADAQGKRNAYIGELIKAALIDNHAALVRARRAIKAGGDSPALLAALMALPLYRPALGVEKGDVAFGDAKVISEGEQGAVGAQFSPKKGEPLAAFAERLQNTLRDEWRQEFAARFAAIAEGADK